MFSKIDIEIKSEDCPTKPWRRRTNPNQNFMFYYVYLIRSVNNTDTIYVGYTTNFKQRLETHNSGGSIHTKKNRPWELVMCTAFRNMNCAKQFEKYLKSQSGRAFAKKRFLELTQI